MKKPVERKGMNVAQRVEVLLRDGVEKPETWVAVKRYDAPAEGSPERTPEWERLHTHHLAECAFLLDVIAELREQVLALDEQLDRPSDAKVGT